MLNETLHYRSRWNGGLERGNMKHQLPIQYYFCACEYDRDRQTHGSSIPLSIILPL